MMRENTGVGINSLLKEGVNSGMLYVSYNHLYLSFFVCWFVCLYLINVKMIRMCAKNLIPLLNKEEKTKQAAFEPICKNRDP